MIKLIILITWSTSLFKTHFLVFPTTLSVNFLVQFLQLSHFFLDMPYSNNLSCTISTSLNYFSLFFIRPQLLQLFIMTPLKCPCDALFSASGTTCWHISSAHRRSITIQPIFCLSMSIVMFWKEVLFYFSVI